MGFSVSQLWDTSDFTARWYCGQWSGLHGWIHIISDLAVFGAYVAIPCVLMFFVRRRRDILFPRVFLLFGAFIFACGTTHLVEAMIFWWPAYRIAAVVKAVTAIVSWATVVALIPVIPQALALPGLKKINAELEQEIAARKRVEEQLRESEFKLRTILEAAGEAIITADGDGKIESANHAAEEMFGRSREDLIGCSVETLAPEDRRDAYEVELRERLRGPAADVRGWELEGGRPDGSRFPLSLSLGQFTQSGKINYTVLIRDITEQKRTEAELTSLNQQLEQRIKHRTALIKLLQEVAVASNEADSVEQAIQFAQNRICEHCGWQVGHFFWRDNRPFSNSPPSDTWFAIRGLIGESTKRIAVETRISLGDGLPGRVLATGKAQWIEDAAHDQGAWLSNDLAGVVSAFAFPVVIDKRVVAMLEFVSSSPIHPDDEFLQAMTNIGTQLGRVVERKQSETAIRNSEARFRTVFQHAAVGMALGDEQGRIQETNEALRDFYGCSEAELRGKRICDFLCAEHLDDNHSQWRSLLEGRVAKTSGEHRFLGPTKKTRWGILTTSLVRDASGRTMHSIDMIQDISERKDLEQRMADLATEEQRSFGQELHDGVGQELTGLVFVAKSLLKRLSDAPPAIYETVFELSEGLKHAVTHVRAIARGLIPVEVDAEGLRAALEGLAATTAQRYDVCSEWLGDQAVRVEDNDVATQLFHIAREGVNNAVKHGRPEHVWIDLCKISDGLQLTIKDDGVGIASDPMHGNGAGLRIMKHRASLIGATLEVRRGEVGGTILACTLRGNRKYDGQV